MHVDEAHPLNLRVLRHLRHRPRASTSLLDLPHDHPDPHLEAGTHPDVVDHLWTRLGSRLPVDGRCLVYGTPALVTSGSGIVIAVGWGTKYALRLTSELHAPALEAGCSASVTWSGGTTTDLHDEIGADWLFGAWVDAEGGWVRACSDRLDP